MKHSRDGARLALAGVVALAALLACGKSEEAPETRAAAPSPAAQKPAPRPPPQSVEEQTKGVGTGEAGTMPEGFPPDLPVYPEAQSSSWLSAAGTGFIVAFQSSDPPEDVFDYYTENLPGAGWKVESQSEAGGRNWVLVAGKGGLVAKFSIGKAKSGAGSEFGIAVTEAK